MSKSATIELKEIEEIVTLEECNNEIKKCYFMINTLQMKSLKDHYNKLFEKLKEFDRNVSNAIKMAKKGATIHFHINTEDSEKIKKMLEKYGKVSYRLVKTYAPNVGHYVFDIRILPKRNK